MDSERVIFDSGKAVRFCFLFQSGFPFWIQGKQVEPAPVRQTTYRDGEKEVSPRTFLALPKIIPFGL